MRWRSLPWSTAEPPKRFTRISLGRATIGASALLDPGDLERLLPRGEEAHVGRLPVGVHRRDHAHRNVEVVNRDPTSASAASPPVEANHTVTRVDESLRLSAQIAERVEHVLDCLPDAVVPVVSARARQLRRRPPFDVGMRHLQEAVEVSAVEGLEPVLDDLDVLLRHVADYPLRPDISSVIST